MIRKPYSWVVKNMPSKKDFHSNYTNHHNEGLEHFRTNGLAIGWMMMDVMIFGSAVFHTDDPHDPDPKLSCNMKASSDMSHGFIEKWYWIVLIFYIVDHSWVILWCSYSLCWLFGGTLTESATNRVSNYESATKTNRVSNYEQPSQQPRVSN